MSDVPGARSLTLGEQGTVFVGTRPEGKVYAIPDTNHDQKGDTLLTLAENLNYPNGVAFYRGALYVAEMQRVIRFDGIESSLRTPPAPVVVHDTLSQETIHGWKYLRFGPDSLLYVPIGSPCNVCLPATERIGTILRMDPDGANLTVVAKGIRNTVGFDWHPVTRELWFTDNGRDFLGDNLPPDELNRVSALGENFGFPYCLGNGEPDPDLGAGVSCADYVAPVQPLGAHVASLGMRFYTGNMFPAEYKNQIFIAEHGSQNSTVPVGYRVTLVRLSGNQAVSYEVFADGWLTDTGVTGRPVDILVMPDGALLISDDFGGKVYRLYYKE